MGGKGQREGRETMAPMRTKLETRPKGKTDTRMSALLTRASAQKRISGGPGNATVPLVKPLTAPATTDPAVYIRTYIQGLMQHIEMPLAAPATTDPAVMSHVYHTPLESQSLYTFCLSGSDLQ